MYSDILKPFWTGNLMYEESLTMVKDGDEMPSAPLFYKPDEIISVQDARRERTFTENTDWVYSDGLFRLTRSTSAPYLTSEEMYPRIHVDGKNFPGDDGGFVLYREGHFFHDSQITVTYRHSDTYNGPHPVFCPELLPLTIDKLRREKSLNMVLFGDSIASGANASYVNDAPPYMPSWGALCSLQLKKVYDADVRFINTSVGGKDSAWGLVTVDERVCAYNPDLVILAFGMNDGSMKVSPDKFISNIRGMIEKIRACNPLCEFILVSTTLPNPRAIRFAGPHKEYLPLLFSLSGTGTAVLDMTSVHERLISGKRYVDMIGNNINHPNDFLIRIYAQCLCAMLTEENQ